MHFLLYVLFVNDLLLVIYYMFILGCGNDVRQKANLSSFVIQVQMGCKAVVTTCNINNTFGPGTTNKHTVQLWFKKFCKGDESLDYEECSGQPSEGDSNQLRDISEADFLTFTQEVAEELNVDHSMVIWH